jgi:chemotaxis protein methyltransferase CheR
MSHEACQRAIPNGWKSLKSDSNYVTLTAEEHDLLNALLSEKLGLHFPEHKRDILESRLQPRLQALGLNRFVDYYIALASETNGAKIELKQLTQAVTNNETYFFRETLQLDALFGDALGQLRQTSPFQDTLRILCAGCSSGEEVYTTSIYATENQYQLGGCKVDIHGIDVDTSKLELARRAEYGNGSLRNTTPEQLLRYFRPLDEDRYLLRPHYRKGTRFSAGNIVDPSLFSVPAIYDAVLCRNVLIYFSETTMKRAVRHFAYCLRPGGLLLLGHSESILGKSELFEPVRIGGCLVYQRVGHAMRS